MVAFTRRIIIVWPLNVKKSTPKIVCCLAESTYIREICQLISQHSLVTVLLWKLHTALNFEVVETKFLLSKSFFFSDNGVCIYKDVTLILVSELTI